MKKIILIVILFSSCNAKQQDISSQAEKEIMEADIAMSNLATKDGFYKALLQYAADSVIIPREGKLPMIGKTEVNAAWSSKPVLTTFTWKPIRAEAAKSGDMGYTFGYATFVGKDTTTYTNYCSIWKKQKDGTWKFVYDGGNNIPKPNWK